MGQSVFFIYFFNWTESTVYTRLLPHQIQSQLGWPQPRPAVSSTQGAVLHTAPYMCPLYTPGCIGWIGDWWVVLERGDWACSLLTHPTHRHTHIHSQGQASISSLSLSFTHTLEKQRRRQGGELVGVTASGCCQAVVIWLDYQPGGNIQPIYPPHTLTLPLPPPPLPSSSLAPSIYHFFPYFFHMPFFLYLSTRLPFAFKHNEYPRHTNTHTLLYSNYRPSIPQAWTETKPMRTRTNAPSPSIAVQVVCAPRCVQVVRWRGVPHLCCRNVQSLWQKTSKGRERYNWQPPDEWTGWLCTHTHAQLQAFVVEICRI